MTFLTYALAVIGQTRRPRGALRPIDPAHLRACFETRLGIAEAAARLAQHYGGASARGHI